MRIMQINGGVAGSTGKIMMGIARAADQQGHAAMCASPITTTNRRAGRGCGYYRIGTFNGRRIHAALARMTGFCGCFARRDTGKLLRAIDEFRPDVLQLHTLHDSFINLPMLFDFIKQRDIPVVWTLHDCWAFTGHCTHFTAAGCGRWKSGCRECPQYREYPASLFDNSRRMWELKRKWFTGIKRLTVVTPSEWLAGLVRQSFLKDYPVTVIHNGIDTEIFRPTDSGFRERYGIASEQKMILGVSFGWNSKKGLDFFIRLASAADSARFRIVLVGTDGETDRQLPSGIISIHRTQDQTELAEIYTAADVFVNPTKEEVLGLVNIEAQACGTPVIMLRTGGCPECITRESGIIADTQEEMAEAVLQGRFETISRTACVESARRFRDVSTYGSYLAEYEKLTWGADLP